MKDQKEAEKIVDSILSAENECDDYVSIPWWTRDIEYGWLITHYTREYRDSKDDSKIKPRYGGSKFIVDKIDNLIWRIPASFHLIDREIEIYKKLKNQQFDSRIIQYGSSIKRAELEFDFLNFCIKNSYTELFIDNLKLVANDLLIAYNDFDERTYELLKNFVENDLS
jgi:hypothetical protein